MLKLNKFDIHLEVILGILMCAKAQILCLIFKEFVGNEIYFRPNADLCLVVFTVSVAYRHQQGPTRILKINTKVNILCKRKK